ncbi:MAG: DUF4129 domain-containing protein [Pyrinomonadaceae bacterium]|nr:DUF4129 domain-containing protein [Pyrinomonadaceae bacterium]
MIVSRLSFQTVLLGCLLLCALAGPAAAIPLDEYLDAITKARKSVAAHDNIKADLGSEGPYKEAIDTLEEVRIDLGAIEEVEFNGNTLRVNNNWIESAVSALKKKEDSLDRLMIVQSVSERLKSIEYKVGDLERATEQGLTKDEEKQRLSKILQREEFKPASEEGESPAARAYRILMEWLRSLFPQVEPVTPTNSGDFTFLKGVIQATILILVIAIIGYVVFKFGGNFIGRFGSKEKSAKSRLILGEKIEEGTTTKDLFSEAEALAQEGDIRGAIRKGYISLLFELSERRLIGLAKHKTNRDYLRDLTGEIKNGVAGLTFDYEKHWYGRRLADEDEWAEFKNEYERTLGHSRSNG